MPYATESRYLKSQFDAVLRLYAGYDETGVWQEFGEMKFQTRDDIPAAWGNPNPALPRWVVTRYVPWTSWRAGAMQWGLSTIRQGDNSGTITHELGHFALILALVVAVVQGTLPLVGAWRGDLRLMALGSTAALTGTAWLFFVRGRHKRAIQDGLAALSGGARPSPPR